MGCTALALALLWAKPPQVPVLGSEHVHPSGAFSFRTPVSWMVRVSPANPEVLEAAGDGVRVRFLYRSGEVGFDSLHVDCMLERLAGPMEQHPQVRYEYDFLSGQLGEFRVLDSAFVVIYDSPIQGQREWRQRNLTLVGSGQSLCLIGYAPLRLWKKSKPTRALLDAVLGSLSFKTAR